MRVLVTFGVLVALMLTVNAQGVKRHKKPQPTPRPPIETVVGLCGEAVNEWHASVISDCETHHEHGDAPPPWIAAAGYQVRYGDIEATPNENVIKHQAYKGFHFRQTTGPNAGQEWYFRYHASSTPHDRAARFHSYALYGLATDGSVSVFRGWYDTGDRMIDRYPPPGPDIRPGIFPVDQTNWDAGRVFESWYVTDFRYDRQEDALWRPEFGLTIGATSTIYAAGEHLTAHDGSTWNTTGHHALTRRVEISWYGPDSPVKRPILDSVPRDAVFYADQFGRLLNGADDPLCGLPVTYGDQTFARICLPHYLSSGLRSVGFPDNFEQKDFDCPGCQVPN